MSGSFFTSRFSSFFRPSAENQDYLPLPNLADTSAQTTRYSLSGAVSNLNTLRKRMPRKTGQAIGLAVVAEGINIGANRLVESMQKPSPSSQMSSGHLALNFSLRLCAIASLIYGLTLREQVESNSSGLSIEEVEEVENAVEGEEEEIGTARTAVDLQREGEEGIELVSIDTHRTDEALRSAGNNPQPSE